MIAIGVEKEILSSNYFSYHYGYKKTTDFLYHEKSKLIHEEKKLQKYFKNINFNVLFLNISSKGNCVNFCLKNTDRNYEEIESILKFKRYGDAYSFSFNLNDIGNMQKETIHREIYDNPNLDNFNILNINQINQINSLVYDFKPSCFAIAFDVKNGIPILDDIHLELFPQISTSGPKYFLNKLSKYKVKNIENFSKYFIKFKKFSHLKFRIKNSEISNIKYYRSINVNLPEFYQ